MMPTLQEIDQIEVEIKSCLNQLFAIHPELALDLCAAARRGVEADIPISAWKREELEWHDRHDKDRIRLGECESQRDAALQRAEKAEAELAALKAAQPQEYPSSADDEATRWRHGEPTQPERVSVPISDEQDYKALYYDLIMQVERKYPGESRHDTAKKYIRFCETPIDQVAAQESK